ncbi:IS3 family transposase [Novosphingobium sp. TH158]|uniref:IS3 family transposase n=1 Tax=Novosphingobium sp. TH158 TaxID=2067455 RepID=UPI00352E1EE6
MSYRPQRDDDAEVPTRWRELTQLRFRFGYCQLHILLLREGIVNNRKRAQRLCREQNLAVRRRRNRRHH